MNRISPYVSYILIIIIYAGVGSFLYIKHHYFVNTNFYFALVTFLVGSFALFIYIKRRSDEKDVAARILFLEVKESERELKKLIEHKVRTGGKDYPHELIIKLIQNRAWAKYSHLFIENFNNDEYQQLDEYFKKCDILEKYFEKQHNFFWISTEERARQKEKIGAKLAYDNPNEKPEDFRTRVENIADLYIANTWNYSPTGITMEINKQLESITLPSVTPIWVKLRRLAGYTK